MIYQSVRDKRDKNYQEGVELYKQYKLEEARKRFKVVVDIEPEYRDAQKYISEIDRLLKIEEIKSKRKANLNYNKSVALINQKKYEDALHYLVRAQQEDPDIADIDKRIDECRKKLVPKLEETLKQAEKLYERKSYIRAYKAYLKTEVYDPSNLQARSLKNKIEKKLDENAKKFRISAKEYYDKKQYKSAQRQLQLALNQNPWDKESNELLPIVNSKLNLDKDYKKAIALYESEDYFRARSSFHAINDIENGYKATNQYLEKINKALNNLLPEIYKKGLALYEKGEYQMAINEFTKVLSIDPGHSMALEYRQRAQSKLDTQKSLQGASQ